MIKHKRFMSYSVENIIKDINKFKLIYKCFLYFNQTFSIFLNIIPNEIFGKILEYYYDSIIIYKFKCNKIECIKDFKLCIKSFIQSKKNVESFTEYYHCIDEPVNCHSFFTNDQLLTCYYCELFRCPYCIDTTLSSDSDDERKYFTTRYVCNYCNQY